ncbi:MAG: hypothetical protein ABI216_21825, partial [Devosia sp.]
RAQGDKEIRWMLVLTLFLLITGQFFIGIKADTLRIERDMLVEENDALRNRYSKHMDREILWLQRKVTKSSKTCVIP